MKKMKLKTKFALAAAGAAAFTTLGWVGGDYNSTSTEQATVQSVKYGQDDSHYTVYTDNGVYTDNDSYINFKFNSDDIVKELQPGCTYDFNVHGWRSDLLNTVPNIDSVTFVPTIVCPKAPKIA